MKLPNQLPFPCLFSLLFLLLAHQSISAAASSLDTTHQSNNATKQNSLDLNYIKTSCGATLYPEVCYHSLSRYSSAIQRDPARLARAAMALSLSRARRLSRYLSNASRQAEYGSDRRSSSALHDCSSNLGDAVDEIRDSLKQMREVASTSSSSNEEFRFQMSNVQTWMSAALTDEDTCTDGFEDVSNGPLKTDISNRVADVQKITSNALALVNSYVTSKTG